MLSYASAFIDLGVIVVVNGTRLAVKAYKYIDDIPEAAKVVNTVTGEMKTGKELAEALIKGGDEIVESVGNGLVKEGLGKITGKTYQVIQSKIDSITRHLSGELYAEENVAMINRFLSSFEI